jgi:hypothetical protein
MGIAVRQFPKAYSNALKLSFILAAPDQISRRPANGFHVDTLNVSII